MAGTPKKNSDELLARRVKDLELLEKSSQALNSTLNFDRLVNVILKIVGDALNVETVSILFFDQKKENMVFEMARGKNRRSIEGVKIPVGQGVVGWVAKHQRPVIVNDLKKDKRYSPRIEKQLGLKVRSILSIPLKQRNRLIGVIEAVNRRGKEPFTDDDLRLFMALGDHIATALDNARLYREAERRRLEHSVLYKISVALSKSLTLDQVLEEILKGLKKILPYDAAAIFVLDRKEREIVSHLHKGYEPGKENKLRLKLDEGVVGWAARRKRGAVVGDTRQDDRYVNARKETRSEIVAPMLIGGKVVGMVNLESNEVDAYQEPDLDLLSTFAAQAAVSIERARLSEEEREKRGIMRELRLARTIQQFFTPRKSQKLGKFTLTGRNYPSLELSGDYFDVFPLKKPYTLIAIADVAGKGVPASIISSGFRATLHTAAPYFYSARDIAIRANEILLETVRPHDFVTAFIGVLNRETGDVTYCNAGHNPAILMSPNGKYELLETGGPILGVLEDIRLEQGSFRLKDELLFIYTDGTTDATNRAEQPFGQTRLIKFLRAHRHLAPTRLCTELFKYLKAYMDGSDQIDDVTFLVLKK